METKKVKPTFAEEFELFKNNVTKGMVKDFADELGPGITPEAIEELGIGYYPGYCYRGDWGCWIFAERDAKGEIIGLSIRPHKGDKHMIKGSKRGLIYAYNSDHEVGDKRYDAGKCQWINIQDQEGLVCPICASTRWCMVSSDNPNDPSAVICNRISQGSVREMLGGGHLHILKQQQNKGGSVLPETELPIIIVEGASDVLAAMSLGFIAIGRPTALGGMKLLREMPFAGKEIWIIGDNDAGAGMEGVQKTYVEIRGMTKDIKRILPPEGTKDLRQWIQQGLTRQGLYEYVTRFDETIFAPIDMFHQTDIGNAERFVTDHQDEIRYNRTTGKWLNWDGCRWNPNTGEDVAWRYYAKTIKRAYHEAVDSGGSDRTDLLKWIKLSESDSSCRGALSYIKTMLPIVVGTEDFDKDNYLFNCLDGTVDLRTGILKSHDSADMITHLAPVYYSPEIDRPSTDLWRAYLNKCHNGNLKTINYLQRLAGMCLTGDVSSQCFPIFWGSGRNGKNVFLDTLRGFFGGDYATTAPKTLLTVSRYNEHLTEIADLAGRRLIIASETERGAALKTELVKAMTGDQRMKGRFMRRDNFEFDITHKVILVTNHKPLIKDESDAIWDRVHLINWGVYIKPEERDTKLTEKLKDEWTGILRWAIKGCLMWQKDGNLIPTEVIRRQTDEYRDEQNILDRFIRGMCKVDRELFVPVKVLKDEYDHWAVDLDEEFQLSTREFSKAMTKCGYTKATVRMSGDSIKCWIGIELQPKNTK